MFGNIAKCADGKEDRCVPPFSFLIEPWGPGAGVSFQAFLVESVKYLKKVVIGIRLGTER